MARARVFAAIAALGLAAGCPAGGPAPAALREAYVMGDSISIPICPGTSAETCVPYHRVAADRLGGAVHFTNGATFMASTVFWLAGRFERYFLPVAEKTELLVVLLGTNDSTMLPAAGYQEKLSMLVALWRAERGGPGDPVLLVTPPPLPAGLPAERQQRLAAYRDALLELCAASSGDTFCLDAWSLTRPEHFLPPDIHPVPAWHREVGEALARTLSEDLGVGPRQTER